MSDKVKIEKHLKDGAIKPSREYRTIEGPSYLKDVPSDKEWLDFISNIENPETKEFAEIWRDKSKVANDVPLRRDLDFRTLVQYGRQLTIYKRTKEGRWLTTYCGEGVVNEVNLEITNKHIDEYADEETLQYWIANIQLITERRMPIFEVYTLEYNKKEHKTACVLNLPLRKSADNSIDMFICHESYLYL